MNEYGVFLVMSSVVGFTLSIISALKKYVSDPLNKLDRTLVKTNTELEAIKNDNINLNVTLSQHDKQLNNHETRITVIENIKFVKDRS